MATTKIYVFVQKNDNVSVIVSGDSEDEAWDKFKEIVKESDGWRIDYVEEAEV